MQLQMTAPLDIGLDQNDTALNGPDVFDLESAERDLPDGQSVERAVGELDDALSDMEEEEREEDTADSDSEEVNIDHLETELDGLYEAYKERMNEKSAKFRIKEERSKHKDRDEWQGIREENSDEESGEESEEGGYDRMMEAKEDEGNSDSDSDSESEDDSVPPARDSKKRKIAEVATGKTAKRTRLISGLSEPKPNGTSQLWFKQDIFKELNVDDISDDDEQSDGVEEKSIDGVRLVVFSIQEFAY